MYGIKKLDIYQFIYMFLKKNFCIFFFSEAEYVYRLRKDFVPLRLQRDYVPDGWLGIMVGTRLYFDVYTEETIDMQIPRLVKELRDRGKIFPCDIVDQGEAHIFLPLLFM